MTGILIILISSLGVAAVPQNGGPVVTTFVTGLDGSTGAGSTIGPDGDLYIAEGAAGRISRVDRQTGDVTTFAEGLPQGDPAIGIGGPLDVAFIGNMAYTIVTLVGADVGGSDTVGIYRIDGPNSSTIIADIGQYSTDNPPSTPFDVPSGVQYAMEPYDGGFLVTDGHHNRVLYVTLAGNISEVIAFGNTVPTGLELLGDTVYMAEAGPSPHTPANGKIMSFDLDAPTASEVAAGARLAVDVELGSDLRLYALSQGKWDGVAPGSPALPDTGALMRAEEDGTFTTIVDWLDRPSSMEIVGDTFYVLTLGGEIWKIKGVSGPPYLIYLSRI